MRVKVLLMILFVALLAACDAATPTQEAEAPNTSPTDSGNEVPAEDAAAKSNADFSGATTVEAASVVRAQDWTKGAEDAAVTIIEYGDFQ